MTTSSVLYSEALALHVTTEKSLLVGIGNQAHLYTESASKQLPLQTGHKKVHGFSLGTDHELEQLLLLYTDNEYSIFIYNKKQDDQPFKLLYEAETKDWINAATFLQNEQAEEQFVLHMAHSTLLRVQCQKPYKAEFSGCTILELARCTDYSMLYHTHLHGSRYDELVIISGNGFGELLIWQPKHPVECNKLKQTKIYPLLLRLQAHNGVIFSIDYNPVAGLLITTSDDRSVQFWQVQNATEQKSWLDVQVKSMCSCFGHTARVMCAIIVEYAKKFYVISGGEDSFICIWNHLGELLIKRREQFGAPIWRLAYDNFSSTLYSSGSTGNVLANNLPNLLEQQQDHVSPMPDTKFLQATAEFMANVKFLKNNTVIGLTNKYRLFYKKLDNVETAQSWKLVDCFTSGKSTVLAVQDDLIVSCGYKSLRMYSYEEETENFQQLYDGQLLEGIIRAFQFLHKDLFLVSDELGNCLLLKGRQLNIAARIKLPAGSEPWLTAALFITTNCLLFSNRKGHVMVYARPDTGNFEHKCTLKRLHGTMGATLLNLLHMDEKNAYILSAGHESTLKYLQLDLTNSELTISKRECVPLSWVEAAPDQDMLLGFNDNHIVVWSRQRDVLLQLQCGGGHRCWDYQLHNNMLRIIFVKLKQVFYHQQCIYQNTTKQLQLLTRNRWHARNCNVMRLLELTSLPHPVLLSAGDDNIIKISSYVNNNFQQLDELHTHISSVRHLTAYLLQEQPYGADWLIFSVGGRAQLCINKLSIQQLDGAILLPAFSELCTHTLRTCVNASQALLEARLMAIDVLRNSVTGNFSIYIACADGKIRLYGWELQQPAQLQSIHHIDLQRCPLQLRYLPEPNLLLIGTTNGELYGFDASLRNKLLQLQLHAAGVNALDVLVVGEQLHVLSGGDDENVKHTIVQLNDMSVTQEFSYLGLHDAQVNALLIEPNNKDKTALWAYTCGIDKQLYRLNLSNGQHNSMAYTCIADIKGLLLDAKKRMYFYGCGLEVMSLE